MRSNSAYRFIIPVMFSLLSLIWAATGCLAESKNSDAAKSAAIDEEKQTNPSPTKPSDARAESDAADDTESVTKSNATDPQPAITAAGTEADSAQVEAGPDDTAAEADPLVLTEEQIKNLALKHWERSEKYYRNWDWKMCELELELAIMEWPQMQIAHRDLCVLSFLQFNWPRSIAEFMMTVGLGDPIPLNAEEVEKLTNTAMVKHYNKGMEFARKEDWKNTIEELSRAAELKPGNSVVQRSLAFAYANSGDFKAAEQCYERTFSLAPSDGSSHADFAYMLADQGKMGEAQKQLEEAVKSSPDTAAYHVDLCWVAESRGDFTTACDELKRAVELSPKHPGLWTHLGRIYEAKGEKEQAVEAYQKALWLDPQQADAKAALGKLLPAQT